MTRGSTLLAKPSICAGEISASAVAVPKMAATAAATRIIGFMGRSIGWRGGKNTRVRPLLLCQVGLELRRGDGTQLATLRIDVQYGQAKSGGQRVAGLGAQHVERCRPRVGVHRSRADDHDGGEAVLDRPAGSGIDGVRVTAAVAI